MEERRPRMSEYVFLVHGMEQCIKASETEKEVKYIIRPMDLNAMEMKENQ